MSDYPKQEIDYMFERLASVDERLKRLEAQVRLPDVPVEHTTSPLGESVQWQRRHVEERLAVLVNRVRSLAVQILRVGQRAELPILFETANALMDAAIEAES